MSDVVDFPAWRNGETAEDFARLVNEGLGECDAGVVVIPCEDYTLPDHAVLGGNFEQGEVVVPYLLLFSGALEHFHGISAGAFRAVPTGAPVKTPFSMALEIGVSRQQSEA